MKKIILLLLVLLLVPLAYAIKPDTVVAEGDSDFEMKFWDFGFAEQGHPIVFHTHIFNKSTGVPVTGDDVDCYFHLYNQTGQHIYQKVVPDLDPDFEYEVEVAGSNFTKLGLYSYIFQCNNSGQGGFAGVYFEVTPDGKEVTKDNGLVMVSLTVLIVAIIFSLLVLTLKMPSLLTQLSLLTMTSYFISFGFFLSGRLFEIVDPYHMGAIRIVFTFYKVFLNLSHVVLMATTIYWLYYLWTNVMNFKHKQREDEGYKW